MATMPVIRFTINLVPVPLVVRSELPEELPPDEGTMSEEEFREILLKTDAYIAEFGAYMAQDEEVSREYGL